MSPIRRVKTKIGDLLLQKGLITSGKLQEALSLQHGKDKDKPIGQILVELGYVNKDELYTILAIQIGYPYINIGHCTIRPEVLCLVPKAMVEKYQVFPIDKMQGTLTVAMVNPLDKVAIDQIQKFTNAAVRVFLTTPPELKEMLSRYYESR
jgi:type IV pilus assembly protein PilB